MYQNKVSQLISEISKLAVEITMQKRAIVFVDYAAHVQKLYVRIYKVGTTFDGAKQQPAFTQNIWLEIWRPEKREQRENEAVHTLNEIKAELEKYLSANKFSKVWESFKIDIEAEILECIKSARTPKTNELFIDVMLETDGHEISLDCVYQSYKLTSEINAGEFKKEMLSNIEWLTNMIEDDYRDVV